MRYKGKHYPNINQIKCKKKSKICYKTCVEGCRVAAEVEKGSSSRKRTTSEERAENERRTISKFPASIDLRQVVFCILPNIRTAFLSPPLVTFYLPRSSRDGESGSPSPPHFSPSISPAPQFSARISAARLRPPLDFPPALPPPSLGTPAFPRPTTRHRLAARLRPPPDSPPDFTQPKRFVFSHKRRVRPHKPPPSSRTALGGTFWHLPPAAPRLHAALLTSATHSALPSAASAALRQSPQP